MAERKGFANHEPAEAKAGEKKGMDEEYGKAGEGKKAARHSKRKSARKSSR